MKLTPVAVHSVEWKLVYVASEESSVEILHRTERFPDMAMKLASVGHQRESVRRPMTVI